MKRKNIVDNYRNRYKANVFLDKRALNNNETKSLEEKFLKRYIRSQKGNIKYDKFNLEANKDDFSFNMDRGGDVIVEDFDELNEHIFINSADNLHVKTIRDRREVMNEVIGKSKTIRLEKKITRCENTDLLSELNNELSYLDKFISTKLRKKSYIEESGKYKDYENLLNGFSLGSRAIAVATDRIKPEDEIVSEKLVGEGCLDGDKDIDMYIFGLVHENNDDEDILYFVKKDLESRHGESKGVASSVKIESVDGLYYLDEKRLPQTNSDCIKLVNNTNNINDMKNVIENIILKYHIGVCEKNIFIKWKFFFLLLKHLIFSIKKYHNICDKQCIYSYYEVLWNAICPIFRRFYNLKDFKTNLFLFFSMYFRKFMKVLGRIESSVFCELLPLIIVSMRLFVDGDSHMYIEDNLSKIIVQMNVVFISYILRNLCSSNKLLGFYLVKVYYDIIEKTGTHSFSPDVFDFLLKTLKDLPKDTKFVGHLDDHRHLNFRSVSTKEESLPPTGSLVISLISLSLKFSNSDFPSHKEIYSSITRELGGFSDPPKGLMASIKERMEFGIHPVHHITSVEKGGRVSKTMNKCARKERQDRKIILKKRRTTKRKLIRDIREESRLISQHKVKQEFSGKKSTG